LGKIIPEYKNAKSKLNYYFLNWII